MLRRHESSVKPEEALTLLLKQLLRVGWTLGLDVGVGHTVPSELRGTWHFQAMIQ